MKNGMILIYGLYNKRYWQTHTSQRKKGEWIELNRKKMKFEKKMGKPLNLPKKTLLFWKNKDLSNTYGIPNYNSSCA